MQEASDLEREWSASKAPKLSAGRKRGKCSSASDLRNKAAKLHYQPAQHRKLRLTPVHPEVLFDAGRNLTEEPDTEQQASPAAASLPEDTDEDCVTQVNSTTPVASAQTAENNMPHRCSLIVLATFFIGSRRLRTAQDNHCSQPLRAQVLLT